MMICNRCTQALLRLTQQSLSTNLIISSGLPSLPLLLRRLYATTWKRRVVKQQELKKVVYEYATKNTKRTDRVYVWGNAVTGALGVKSFLKPAKHQPVRDCQHVPYRLDFLASHNMKAKHLACGYGYTVYLCDTGAGQKAFGCGLNMDSQLGYQQYPPNSGRILDYVIQPAVIDLPLIKPQMTKLTKVGCGRAHTWILTDNEGIFTLGNNAHGQCGRPVVQGELYRGSQIINKVPFDKNIKQICCGLDHTVVLTDQGQVYSCGLGADGQTGQGHYGRVEELSKVIGDIEGENIISIATRVDCVLAVSDKGDVFGWGSSEYGQLASADPDVTQINVARCLPFKNVGKIKRAAAASSICAILNDEGDVYVWGRGIIGKGPKVDHSDTPDMLPRPLFGQNELNPHEKVVDLQCGHSHLAAVTDSGQLYMWGKNTSACLGLGNTLDQFFPFKVEVPAEVHQLACGADHSAVICKSFA